MTNQFFLTIMSNPFSLETLRHSCAHILAASVKELYPQVKLGIGPAIKEGFYYDFLWEKGFSPDDLEKISRKMQEIIDRAEPFEKKVLSKEQAGELLKDEPFKLELLKDIPDKEVSFYSNGGFSDLCRGPHINNTGQVKAFRLLTVSGAYWRGKEGNPMMQRIYGTAFFSQKELESYLAAREEAKKRDHRKLGVETELFDFFPEQAGPGLVFYLKRGAVLKRIIEDWEIKEHLKRGYIMVNTPQIMAAGLWQKSGHLDFYREYMYLINTPEGDFCVKPMNCPGHMLIYKTKIRSYRDLPLKIFELGTVYRYEKSGVLHGLLRVRGFTQDDAHIFCRPGQLEEEIEKVLVFVKEAMQVFGFGKFEAELSTRPEKFIGEAALWDKAEAILENVLKKGKIQFSVNPQEGAFYGPKIDIKLEDALGRKWQCATVQLDFSLPQRFGLYYIDEQGRKQQPVMVHRVILGSLERFIATLTEHYKARFPLWLCPLQVKVVPVSRDFLPYAEEIKRELEKNSVRVEVSYEEETLSKKIRSAEKEKAFYIIVVGKKEQAAGEINVRAFGRKVLGSMPIAEFLNIFRQELQESQIPKY